MNQSTRCSLQSPSENSLPINSADDGILPLRLLEPISSLTLTPFAAKAVRGTGGTTIGDLVTLVFEKGTECRGMGQSHLEEIRRKIEDFVGRPPYAKEQHIDIPSLLRIALSCADPSEKAIIVTCSRIQAIVPLSVQESKEADMALLKEKDRKFRHAIDTIRPKTAEKICPLLEMISGCFIEPWMHQRGGIAHNQEILQFLFERSSLSDYALFTKTVRVLEILSDKEFLFSQRLHHVDGNTWAVSAQKHKQALSILNDARTLIGTREENGQLKALSKAIVKCHFDGWEDLSVSAIERLLYWRYSDRK